MAVECSGRNVEVTPSLRKLAEGRAHRLERHLGGAALVRVVLWHEKHRFGAEVIATHRRRRWKAEEETADPRAALALAFEKIDAQAMRDTEKRRDRKHRIGSKPLASPARERVVARSGNGNGARVVRSRPAAKPMGVDEAALAIEASGEDVLVFRDASSDRISVLYRRRDGDLGLIVPEC